ncbi:MAG: UDP-glucuronosyltransferase [bacterium]|nr:UDP-glucuronosyltransferase [bacterium]
MRLVTILCSGVALGVYIPAMHLNYALKRAGIETEVIVLENLIYEEKKNKINANKKAFHENFKVALLGQRMAGDIRPSLDQAILDKMYTKWEAEGRERFVVFSGFWIPILQDYEARIAPGKIDVELCHMDVAISASWKKYMYDSPCYHHRWFFSIDKHQLGYEFPVDYNMPLSFEERENRYMIHGGGWGMGTYQSKIPELEAAQIPLDIVAYAENEINLSHTNNRYFMTDPNWSPWLKNQEGEHEFPPFAQIVKDVKSTKFINHKNRTEVLDVIGTCKAIISKPGGATLVDSLASATPMIMLDPFGGYEKKNAELWIELGFGIDYDTWRESNYDETIIKKLHENLMAIRGTQEKYITLCIEKWRQ